MVILHLVIAQKKARHAMYLTLPLEVGYAWSQNRDSFLSSNYMCIMFMPVHVVERHIIVVVRILAGDTVVLCGIAVIAEKRQPHRSEFSVVPYLYLVQVVCCKR